MTEYELIARLNRLEEIQRAHQEMHRSTVAVLRSLLEQMTGETPAAKELSAAVRSEIQELERLAKLEPPAEGAE